jgi:hypothetical protein
MLHVYKLQIKGSCMEIIEVEELAALRREVAADSVLCVTLCELCANCG